MNINGIDAKSRFVIISHCFEESSISHRWIVEEVSHISDALSASCHVA